MFSEGIEKKHRAVIRLMLEAKFGDYPLQDFQW